jgi:hypothetical protein
MTFYVVYRAPRNDKNRGVIPNELRSLGCVQLHKSLWQVQEEKIKKVLQVLQRHGPILLRRTREIRKPEWNRKGMVIDIGSLSIVAYNIPNGKRKLVNRVLWKMPCIPLCRAVYALPHRHALLDKNNTVDTLLKLIKSNEGSVKAISRIVIEDSASIQQVVNEVEERIEQEALDIATLSERLFIKIKENGGNITNSSQKLANLSQRYLALKKVTSVYEKWLKLNFSKNMLKTYRAIKKTKEIIEQD